MRYVLGTLAFLLSVTACKEIAAPKGVDPCSAPGKAAIEAVTPISKPAHGNFDELDPKLTGWARAEALSDTNVLGDQCRSVLGTIPTISCPDSPLIPVTVNGKTMTYENGVFLEDGKPTKWRPEDGCDHPGLLALLFATTEDPNPKEGCLPNARLGGSRNGPVAWAWVCHNLAGYHEKTDRFDFVTIIGSNTLTGETCFFGHSSPGDDKRRTHGKDLVPPGGWHPGSSAEREKAKAFWDWADEFSCIGCHGADRPFMVTPHTNQSRVGGDGSMEIIPKITSFRLIGTAPHAVLAQKPELRPRAIYPKNDDGTPDRTCTKCHTLTNQETFLRLARYSVGLGDLPKHAERTKEFLHDPKAWMPPGNDGSPDATASAQAAVKRYERAFYDASWRYKESDAMGPCRAPAPLPASAVKAAGAGKIEWTYKNDYGQVPLRDDVRFKVTLQSEGGSQCTIRDVAPESLGGDRWRFSHPADAGARYTYRITPYRYCFDESIYSNAVETVVE